MRAEMEDAGSLSELVKIVWPEHTLEELVKIIAGYMNSENSAVFAEVENGQYVGVECQSEVTISGSKKGMKP